MISLFIKHRSECTISSGGSGFFLAGFRSSYFVSVTSSVPFSASCTLEGDETIPATHITVAPTLIRSLAYPPPPPLRYINHAAGMTTVVGVDTSYILGAGEGLFAGKCKAENQIPISAYIGNRLTYDQFLVLSLPDCTICGV